MQPNKELQPMLVPRTAELFVSRTRFMTDRKTQLLATLRIGHETSMRGTGIFLNEALTRTDYKRLRIGFDPHDLLPLIETNPRLGEVWIAYSCEKGTVIRK